MATRQIQSPGVQISEVDLSLRNAGVGTTTVLVPGYAPKGPTSEPLTVGSLSEFEQIYGLPTNAAERYFYHTAAAVFQSPVNVLAYRLPYGVGAGVDTSSNYSALVYPVISNTVSTSAYVSGLFSAMFSAPVGATVYQTLSSTTYRDVLSSGTQLPGTFQQLTVAQALGLSANAIGTTYGSGVSSTVLNVTSGTYIFGRPTHYKLTQQQYLGILKGTSFTWSTSSGAISATNAGNQAFPTINFAQDLSNIGQAGLIILNKSQSVINSRFEGQYVGIIDNTNLNPATNFDDFNSVQTINTQAVAVTGNNYITIPSTRQNFLLSAGPTNNSGSISEVAENISQFDIFSSTFNDTVNFGLFKLRQSVFAPDPTLLDFVLQEGYAGSFDAHRQINDQNGGPAKSFFIENLENNSTNIATLVNPYISQKNTPGISWLDINGNPLKAVRFLSNARSTPIASDSATVLGSQGSFTIADGTYTTRIGATPTQYTQFINTLGNTGALYPLGDYSLTDLTTKNIGNAPSKVDTMLTSIENSDVYPLDVVCEAGLGTVYTNSLNPVTSGYFDDTVPYTNVLALTGQNLTTTPAVVQDYLALANKFVNFATNIRKDHVFIADPLTNIFVIGNNYKTLDDPNANFPQNIYWPINNQFVTIDSSYVCTYGNVVKVYDNAAAQNVWVPFSGFAAAAMGNTDAVYKPWYSPAGFTRGIVTGVTDLGIYPTQKQRDQLYKASINPVAFFPNEGYVIYGQKTSLGRPSAFDRINVRRLFLTVEKRVNNIVKNFVFEPNTLFTRTAIKNLITPIFEDAKNTQGIYDYLIICDERNNTPDIIDQNTLVVDIYIKPVRTAEFILVNFYATRTSQNFAEIVA
jgi:hypothetical protein